MLWPVPTPRRRGPCSPLPCAVAASLLVLSTTATAAPAPTTTPPVATTPATPAPATPEVAPPEVAPPEVAPVPTPPAPPPTSEAPANSPAPAPAATPPVSPPPADTTGALAGTPGTRPPRVDGPYFGGTIAAGGTFARVNNFPTPDPLSGGTASLRVGQAIYPWMTIGLEVTGSLAKRFADPSQRVLQGAVLIDFGFLPVPRIPLSLHVGFGAGGGAVRQADRTARSGFGGAVFTGAVRYEIFPLAARKRPRRGGGFSLGPELGWLGFTPAAAGRPMSNTIYIGLFMGFYFGS
jgi:hypothetical protein